MTCTHPESALQCIDVCIWCSICGAISNHLDDEPGAEWTLPLNGNSIQIPPPDSVIVVTSNTADLALIGETFGNKHTVLALSPGEKLEMLPKERVRQLLEGA